MAMKKAERTPPIVWGPVRAADEGGEQFWKAVRGKTTEGHLVRKEVDWDWDWGETGHWMKWGGLIGCQGYRVRLIVS